MLYWQHKEKEGTGTPQQPQQDNRRGGGSI